jgi:GNAT superfamily N-acetyltransferase
VRQIVDRMRALEHRVQDAVAAGREEFPGGVAYSNRELPAVWDVNFLRLDRACEQPALWADRLQAGLGHRKVLVEEDRLIARFGPGLRERGFGERVLVALARPTEGGEPDPDVRAVPFAEVAPLRKSIVAEQLPAPDPGVVAQVAEAGSLNDRAGGRWLVIHDGDAAVGHCIVFRHDGLAQIEDVAILESHRGRGLSRRLILHALALLEPEHDTAFITAEADDWPIGFYERLGFTPVEERADYLLIVA